MSLHGVEIPSLKRIEALVSYVKISDFLYENNCYHIILSGTIIAST